MMRIEKDQHRAAMAELEHGILHGLACEWETALYVLDTNHQRLLKPPLFSIRSMHSRWGYWDPSKNEICLSRQLVHHYPWDSVREVLLHEMAHQMTDRIFDAGSEKPHGPTFKKSCRLLRANPQASGTHPLLADRIHRDLNSPEDKRIQRVQKLLSLAQSRNRHEAEAAMLKAHELIEKYNLDLLDQNKPRNFVSVFAGEPALRHPREAYHLANLLLDFYFVQGLWVPAFVLPKNKMGRVLEISGTREHIQMAHYVFDFISSFINREWSHYNQAKKLTRRRKTDFAVGIIEGFRNQLSDNRAPKKPNSKNTSKAITQASDPQLNNYFAYRYPHTANVKKKALRQDRTVLKDGIRIGQKMILSKGIVSKNKGKKALITEK